VPITLAGVLVFGVGILLALRRKRCSIATRACCAAAAHLRGAATHRDHPLFHLRAVVVAARRGMYVAYVERRASVADPPRRGAPLGARCSRAGRGVSEVAGCAWCSMQRHASRRPTD
jgi:hypothetical protein